MRRVGLEPQAAEVPLPVSQTLLCLPEDTDSALWAVCNELPAHQTQIQHSEHSSAVTNECVFQILGVATPL